MLQGKLTVPTGESFKGSMSNKTIAEKTMKKKNGDADMLPKTSCKNVEEQHKTSTNFTLLEKGIVNLMLLPRKSLVVVDARPMLPVIVSSFQCNSALSNLPAYISMTPPPPIVHRTFTDARSPQTKNMEPNTRHKASTKAQHIVVPVTGAIGESR